AGRLSKDRSPWGGSPTGGAAMIRLGAAVVVWGLVAGGAWGSSPDPKDLAIPAAELGRARELVRRLGSDDPREREAAQAELARMGRLARPVLAEAAAADPSAEVRGRAARLLPRAEAEELQARLDTFRADTELAYQHDLPGWSQFRVAAGAEWRVLGATPPADKA